MRPSGSSCLGPLGPRPGLTLLPAAEAPESDQERRVHLHEVGRGVGELAELARAQAEKPESREQVRPALRE